MCGALAVSTLMLKPATGNRASTGWCMQHPKSHVTVRKNTLLYKLCQLQCRCDTIKRGKARPPCQHSELPGRREQGRPTQALLLPLQSPQGVVQAA